MGIAWAHQKSISVLLNVECNFDKYLLETLPTYSFSFCRCLLEALAVGSGEQNKRLRLNNCLTHPATSKKVLRRTSCHGHQRRQFKLNDLVELPEL